MQSLTFHITVQRPRNPAYPKEVITLGDMLRKMRLDRRLSQSQVALIVGVTTDTITNWELNRNNPSVSLMKKVIEYVKYNPFKKIDSSLGESLFTIRMERGLSLKRVAQITGCDPGNLSLIEQGIRTPLKKTRVVIERFLKKKACAQ